MNRCVSDSKQIKDYQKLIILTFLLTKISSKMTALFFIHTRLRPLNDNFQEIRKNKYHSQCKWKVKGYS
jgi:hypothetical protein